MKTILVFMCFYSALILPTAQMSGMDGKSNTNAVDDIKETVGDTTSFKEEYDSPNLEYTDFMGGQISTDVYLLCSKYNEILSYRLGFLSEKDTYQYCKVESLNGRLSSNVIRKFQTVQYFIPAQNSNSQEYTDILTIKYYDENDMLLSEKEKYIYWNETEGIYNTLN